MLTFKDFPEEILEFVRYEHKHQKTEFNPNTRSSSDINHGGFNWENSLMGFDFWSDVVGCDDIEGLPEAINHFRRYINYELFKDYIKANKSIKYLEEQKVYLITRKGRKYEVTFKEITNE